MERSVENKVVVVTGGATGLGIEIADKFLANGAKLVIIIDINEQLGIDAVNNLTEKYGTGKAVFIKCDVTSDLDATFNEIISDYKTVDVLINNAGIANEKAMRKTIEVNTIALMEWTSKFYDFMRKDRTGYGGTIINLGSIFGYKIFPFAPSYVASKFAVIGFSKSMGHEYNYKKTNVRVVTLCPGFTYTQLTANAHPRDDEDLEDLLEESRKYEWQEVDAVGNGIIEIFIKADSGTAWTVEGSRCAMII